MKRDRHMRHNCVFSSIVGFHTTVYQLHLAFWEKECVARIIQKTRHNKNKNKKQF